ncbi:alpha-L-fucosidase [Olivibacter sp. CPCC 100613]|uniref:alpha-L-fucosidase n=1 Tax=Olivibacter sp. CPCC 100613 TaxID=3079931 RepID=UPI002FF95BF5
MKEKVTLSYNRSWPYLFFWMFLLKMTVQGQTMDEMWDNRASGKEHPNIQWFKDAKFGLFIHWGLYSHLGGEWKGKRYYGSGEWIMNRAKIPVKEYEVAAASFNPTQFNADEWAQLAKDAGIKYVVITAKHHEGFAMFDSKVSTFDIVDATPYKRDPMKLLADAVRKQGMQFGFYYSQFQDWHDPNGGKNTWDFDESKKDYQTYYRQKAIPQLKELMTNYGDLGIVWFDTPGGLTKEQTQQFVDSLRILQPQSLFSSRVGHGLGDYRDYGDSEMPATPIKGAWESIYTHNDSWGYIKHDMNFKTPETIIQLLAEAASKGGNLMLNVGPDGSGRIPEYSVRFLRETGKWLQINGESIYGTTEGLIPQQPWGVTTSKPGKQYLHVWNRPHNGELLIPAFNRQVKKVYALAGRQVLNWHKQGNDIRIDLPTFPIDAKNTVFVLEYMGKVPTDEKEAPLIVSGCFDENVLKAAFAKTEGNAHIENLTYSHYYGDWKHTTCVVGMANGKTDKTQFDIRITEPGDYQIILEYACQPESANQEGMLSISDQNFYFKTLHTGSFDKKSPLLFIKQPVATVAIERSGQYILDIKPVANGQELFKLKAVLLKPIN